MASLRNEWSEPKWDKDRQQYYVSRRNERGKKVYQYCPAETKTAQDNASTPRSMTDPEHESTPAGQHYSESDVPTTSYNQIATSTPYGGSTYAGRSTSNQNDSGCTRPDAAYTLSDSYVPPSSYSNSAEPERLYDASSSSQYDTGQKLSTWNPYGSSGTGYGSRGTSAYLSVTYRNLDATGGLPTDMRALSLTLQNTSQAQEHTEAATTEYWSADPKLIRKEPGSDNFEKLDPRYQTVPTKDQKWFWKVGRVFMMLWTEPARYQKVGPKGGTRNGSHFSTTWLQGEAYSEIRRFVVIREGHGNCICSPIHTYSNQATLKPNLPDRLQHAIIYTSSRPPEEYAYTADNGCVVRENLSKDPIRVVREQRDKEGDLGEFSRLNYSKIYTVEHYVRLLNIGMIATESMQSLEANSYVRAPTAPPGRPTIYPPPAGSEKRERGSRDTKDKHKSRGSRRPSEHGGGRKHH